MEKGFQSKMITKAGGKLLSSDKTGFKSVVRREKRHFILISGTFHL
jgi:hypothetical protein